MSRTHTYTFALLAVDRDIFRRVAAQLRDAGYLHAFVQVDYTNAIDMNGIALVDRTEHRGEQLTDVEHRGRVDDGTPAPWIYDRVNAWMTEQPQRQIAELVVDCIAEHEHSKRDPVTSIDDPDAVVRGRALAEKCFGQVRSPMQLLEMTWLSGNQWNDLGAYVASLSVPSKTLKNRMAALLIAIKHDTEWWGNPHRDGPPHFAAYNAEASALLSELMTKQRQDLVEDMLASSALSSLPRASEST